MSPRVTVLLSTCNGERFLAEQLDSILDQSHEDLVILVRDDGSRDGTQVLLKKYSQANPERFRLVKNQAGNIGPCASFARLIEHALEGKKALGLADAYLCFADQDDVWHRDRVATCLETLRDAEQDGKLPVLVHADLEVVDAALNPVSDSLAVYQGLKPDRRNFGRALVANAVTGCTAMINERLARLASPIPDAAVMHDWWLALVAAAVGEIVYVDSALVRYRQHDDNALGARPLDKKGSRAWLSRAFDPSSQEIFESLALQAQAFISRFGDQLTTDRVRLCRLATLLGIGPPPLRKILYRIIRRL